MNFYLLIYVYFWFIVYINWNEKRSDKSSNIVKYADGQKVRTAYGDGIISSMYEGGTNGLRYEVELPFGVGLISWFLYVNNLKMKFDFPLWLGPEISIFEGCLKRTSNDILLNKNQSNESFF